LMAAVFAALLLPAGGAAQQVVVYRVPITGTIENGLAPYVARVLEAARAAGAAAAILDIDTPGGRVDAAERIVDAVKGAGLPVYAFVNPRAYSAGAMIALAAEGIVMQPSGVIGAATPVDGQGVKASEKIVSAMRGEFRARSRAEFGVEPLTQFRSVCPAHVLVGDGFHHVAQVRPQRCAPLRRVERARSRFTGPQDIDQRARIGERLGHLQPPLG